ncbi:MAG: DUF4838 domain-containing protein, partial [Victivallales bacterium]|nr:DUF4838 domain-containing protein [Victivallales bacterium]
GKLTRLLLPKDASYLMRWSIALWRGWLWKLTGTALPIEITDDVKPAPGTFVAVKGKTAPGGWQLKIDKNGIVLTYGEELAIAPALFDLLRGLGYAYYAPDCVVELKSDPQRVLPLTDKQVKPRYRYYFPQKFGAGCMNGGIYYRNIFTSNVVDYFHLPDPAMDHVLNVLMPREIYAESHPEYYMMDQHGKRVIEEWPGHDNPCFSNPEVIRICTENLIAYALNQPPRPELLFFVGDIQKHCVCPECVKRNHGTGSYSDVTMMFLNKVARGVARECPDMRVIYGAYFDMVEPPVAVKPEKNICCSFALTYFEIPCTLHVDCELNRAGYEKLAKWTRLMGGRERVGVMTYRDIRPLHSLKQLEFLNKYASRDLFSWTGKATALQPSL